MIIKARISSRLLVLSGSKELGGPIRFGKNENLEKSEEIK